ncbi:T9SS type A sorting domain-containing protein [Fulvivirgaceae bacterium BMA12]|uniref:T9SS type A sorting domain-containing protein n=1 Tax=Agaribacillus aureus TaxID=3051825 RepID=A0ABT8KYZ8_9BACT|nr:T9SS type A sorting domain-containing protein [Fulvivirgaceae bacterium BMA12]
MKNRFYNFPALLLLLCYSSYNCYATHLVGGELKVDKVPGPSLTYKITLSAYVSGSATANLSGTLFYGDGASIDLGSDDFSKTYEPLGDDRIFVNYEILHTYGGPGAYLVRLEESNRNGGILNMTNSAQTPFYIESLIVIDPFIGFNTQPVLLFPPIDKATSGKAFFHNPGGYDPDGDSVTYQLVTPKQSATETVSDYTLPNDAKHYTGFDYNAANEAMNGAPSFGIDASTGDLTWDAPGLEGEYALAIKVVEWRKIQGRWISIGYRVRDMQVLVEKTDNERPDFQIPNDTCILANNPIETSLLAADQDGHEILFSSQSEVYKLSANAASFLTGKGPSDGTSFLDFNWTPNCENARNRPYTVYFKAKDNPAATAGPGLAVYRTWNITVAGAPEGLHGQVKNIGEITLSWNDYFCSAAKSIAIYRIEDNFDFPQDNCQPGVPDGNGFELLAEVNPSDNSFVDDNDGSGLDPNTKYCYRIVAVFQDNIGGESVASSEFCARPDEASLVTGIKDRAPGDHLEDQLAIYPNPAQKLINIDFNLPGIQPLVVGISDMQGKVFRQQQLLWRNNQYQMSLEGTAPGMYLVWVKTATHFVARKIVVN